MIEVLKVVAMLCTLHGGGYSTVILQTKCHAYYAKCLNDEWKKTKMGSMADHLMSCMEKRK